LQQLFDYKSIPSELSISKFSQIFGEKLKKSLLQQTLYNFSMLVLVKISDHPSKLSISKFSPKFGEKLKKAYSNKLSIISLF
jgi:hypothetical protein